MQAPRTVLKRQPPPGRPIWRKPRRFSLETWLWKVFAIRVIPNPYAGHRDLSHARCLCMSIGVGSGDLRCVEEILSGIRLHRA
jgi:hypothetical protein